MRKFLRIGVVNSGEGAYLEMHISEWQDVVKNKDIPFNSDKQALEIKTNSAESSLESVVVVLYDNDNSVVGRRSMCFSTITVAATRISSSCGAARYNTT